MPRFVVVENTPGYLPDDIDEPASFDTFEEAEAYAEWLAQAAADSVSTFHNSETGDTYPNPYAPTVSRESQTLWRIVSNAVHDLGRVVEIIEDES